jgi:hypothetical protein
MLPYPVDVRVEPKAEVLECGSVEETPACNGSGGNYDILATRKSLIRLPDLSEYKLSHKSKGTAKLSSCFRNDKETVPNMAATSGAVYSPRSATIR